MKVLVTGTDGYIGSVLAPFLISKGHEIAGIDTLYYHEGKLFTPDDPFQETNYKDTRKISEDDLSGFDAVIHLAELSNDALGRLDPQNTFEINYHGSTRLAKLAKAAGISKFVYSSSCSVYGETTQDIVTEETEPNPVTAYGECKVLVENELKKLASDDFTPTMLRNATAYGPSPNMRFDIVVNNLSGHAWTTNQIVLTSDGSPWRPLVHVLDICEAFNAVLEAPRDAVHAQILNVGQTKENYTVREIAEIVGEVFEVDQLVFGPSDNDNRSYRVSFEKIEQQLPGFKPSRTVRIGAEQLRALFEQVSLTKETFEYRGYTRLKQLEYLLETGKLDNHLFWSQS